MTDIEVSYFRHALMRVQKAFAYLDKELGLLDPRIEPAIRVPLVEHTPWSLHPIPVKRSIYGRVVRLLKEKLKAGIIEPYVGPYASQWFCVEKKDGKSLIFIQDLQIANGVTVRNAA